MLELNTGKETFYFTGIWVEILETLLLYRGIYSSLRLPEAAPRPSEDVHSDRTGSREQQRVLSPAEATYKNSGSPIPR